jgi:hypothetical protein
METYVVISYHRTNEKPAYLVAVCDNQFIAQRYADMEARDMKDYQIEIHKRIINARFDIPTTLVYQTK